MDAIDLISVKGAISLIDYFEESYQRVKACTITEPNSKSSDDWLEFVGVYRSPQPMQRQQL
jgi:hypothetical protein